MTKTYKQIVTAATPATDARISELEGYRADRFSPTWGLVDTLIARIEADANKIARLIRVAQVGVTVLKNNGHPLNAQELQDCLNKAVTP